MNFNQFGIRGSGQILGLLFSGVLFAGILHSKGNEESATYFVLSCVVSGHENVEYRENIYSMLALEVVKCFKGDFAAGDRLVVFLPLGPSKVTGEMFGQDFGEVGTAGLFRIEFDPRMDGRYFRVSGFLERSHFEWPLSVVVADKIFGGGIANESGD